MVKLGPILVEALFLVSLLHSPSVATAARDHSLRQTKLSSVPAIRLSELSESACFKPSAKDTRNGMYVAVPRGMFKTGEACGKKLLVSCAEPFRDLGGPWHVCKRRGAFNVTIIDQVLDERLDDNLFQLSDKAFYRMVREIVNIPVDSVRLILH